MVPVIVGPERRAHYLIDHHHLARALYEEGVKSVFVTIVADLSRLPDDHFWNMMDFHGWTHPYDGQGPPARLFRPAARRSSRWRTIPIARSPANCARIGGFAKDSTPFSEFLWADFLRPRIKPKAIKADFTAALTRGPDPGEDRRRRLPARLVRTAPQRAATVRQVNG